MCQDINERCSQGSQNELISSRKVCLLEKPIAQIEGNTYFWMEPQMGWIISTTTLKSFQS